MLPLVVCVAQECRTDNAGIVAQLRDHDLGILCGVAGVDFLLDDLLHGNQQRIALVAHAAANAQNVRLENVNGIGDTSCQILDVIVNHLLCGSIAGTQ